MLNCILLYRTVLYCTVPHCTVLFCTVQRNNSDKQQTIPKCRTTVNQQNDSVIVKRTSFLRAIAIIFATALMKVITIDKNHFPSRSSQSCFECFIYCFLFTAYFNSFIQLQSSQWGILNTSITQVNNMFCRKFSPIIIDISMILSNGGLHFIRTGMKDEVFIYLYTLDTCTLRPPTAT